MRIFLLLSIFIFTNLFHADAAKASRMKVHSAGLVSILPNTGVRSQTLTVTITGSATSFSQASTTLGFFNSGTSTAITINSIIVNSSTNLTASITVKANAIVGYYDVQVFSPGNGTLTLYQAFNVTGASISNVTPSTFARNSKLSLTISGSNTHFDQGTGTNVSFFLQGSPTNFIHVDSTKAITANNLTAYISVNKFAPGTTYQLHTFNPTDNEIVYTNNITVLGPALNSITPNTSPNNRTLDVTISGKGTNFTQSSPTNFSFTFFSGSPTTNIIVNSVNVLNDSLVMLNINVKPTASTATYYLSYSTIFDGNLKMPFVVSPGPPSIIAVTPTTAKRGQTLDVTITGLSTGFNQSSATNTVTFMRQGSSTTLIKINSVATLADDIIKVNITMDSTYASVGTYSVTVTDSADGTLSSIPIYFSVINVGVKEIGYGQERIKIYPNPARDIFTIEILNTNETIEQLIITDMLGRKVIDLEKPVLQNNMIQLDRKQLQLRSGTYFIIIQTTNGNYCRKILVE